MVWYSHLFHNFPQFIVIHTVKGFGIVNKAEIDVFLELACFFHDPADVGNLIFGSSAFSKTSLNIWDVSWTVKKVECQRIDAFELWCWRRFLRVPGTARSNQSILKEISPEYSLEGLMLKLKLQYFGHLMQRTDSFEKTLMLGKIEGRRRRWQQMMR